MNIFEQMMTDAVHGGAIGYWANVNNVTQSEDDPSMVTSFTVWDSAPEGEPMKEGEMVIDAAALQKARDAIASGAVPVHDGLKARFAGPESEWEYDDAALNQLIQVAYFGSITYL